MLELLERLVIAYCVGVIVFFFVTLFLHLAGVISFGG